jgi:hypothetical protein
MPIFQTHIKRLSLREAQRRSNLTVGDLRGEIASLRSQ